MIITKSEFSVSSPNIQLCPKDTKPEYAFIGRSNVGKSSLINMLCKPQKILQKTSATPGKTLLINHFIINNEVVSGRTFPAMDLPSAQRRFSRSWSR